MQQKIIHWWSSMMWHQTEVGTSHVASHGFADRSPKEQNNWWGRPWLTHQKCAYSAFLIEVKSPKINFVSSVGPNDYSNDTWRLVNHDQIKYQKILNTELRRDTAVYCTSELIITKMKERDLRLCISVYLLLFCCFSSYLFLNPDTCWSSHSNGSLTLLHLVWTGARNIPLA